MIGPAPICLDCKHLRESKVGILCDAFPDGIPKPIILTEVEHRQPYPGDQGIQYEPKEEA
mgnify:CR=1 FL=1